MNVERVGKEVLDGAFHVQTVPGPGLLESVYEAALVLELRKRGLRVEVQKAIPVYYGEHRAVRVIGRFCGNPTWSNRSRNGGDRPGTAQKPWAQPGLCA